MLKRFPLKTIVSIAMLVALEVVLNRFLSINTTALKIGFGFVPIAVCGMLFGPVAGGIAGGLADFLGAILFPIGPYYPAFTLTAILTGVTFGLFFMKRVRFFPNIIGATAVNCIAFSYFLNSYWISTLYGTPYRELLVLRLVQCGALIAAYLILLPILKRISELLRNKVFIFDPKRNAIHSAADARDYIHSYTRLGSKPGLERTQVLFDKLGNPERTLRCVHVAGTNGKGSTSTMIASMLSAAGYKTGLYTSPYVMCFEESFRINGKNVSGRKLAKATAQVKKAADSMPDHPTVFELKTAVAFLIFKTIGCDFAVIEVGMGGRLDSTNIIPAPVVSVITNIGLDHTLELGDTLEKIASEKAGIIKRSRPVVAYNQQESVLDVFRDKCKQTGSSLTVPAFAFSVKHEDAFGQIFSTDTLSDIHLALTGENQRRNCATALAAVNQIRNSGYDISDAQMIQGLAAARWPARFEAARKKKRVFVIDGGHNPQCAASVSDNIRRYFPDRRILFIIGTLSDKDYRTVLNEYYPLASEFITLKPDSPRAMTAQNLADYICSEGFTATSCDTAKHAVKLAVSKTVPGDIICATGSLYLVGEIRRELRLR